MNSVGILGCVAIAMTILTTSAHPLNKAELHEAAKDVLTTCKSESGASDDDFKGLADHKMPESREGLCMIECVFAKSKIMENGKFSKEGMINGFQPLVGDNEEKQKNLENLASTCEKEIGDGVDDKCENAKLLVDCMVKNGKSHGFEIPSNK